jgi:Rrf2 family protein
MFGISKKTDYGLELMLALARNYSRGPLSLRQIAKERKLPYKFLGQLALELRFGGLIDSKEGKGGGYFLTKKPKKISIAEVVEALEGPVEVGHCFGCPKARVCGQKDVWSEVGDKVRETIKEKTLADLL